MNAASNSTLTENSVQCNVREVSTNTDYFKKHFKCQYSSEVNKSETISNDVYGHKSLDGQFHSDGCDEMETLHSNFSKKLYGILSFLVTYWWFYNTFLISARNNVKPILSDNKIVI